MNLDEQQRAVLFDQLRKHYPKRREFSHYKLNKGRLSEADQNMLATLGFNLI